VNRNGHVRAGDQAGNENKSHPCPYRQIQIGPKNFRASRLIWFYMTGEWPEKEIDHRDRNELNDTWTNLRLATSTQNKINQRLRCDNKTGFRGVHRHGRKFCARANIDRKYKHLGMFDTAEEAYAHYKKVTSVVHGEYVYHG
jgi:hypothetical protein